MQLTTRGGGECCVAFVYASTARFRVTIALRLILCVRRRAEVSLVSPALWRTCGSGTF